MLALWVENSNEHHPFESDTTGLNQRGTFTFNLGSKVELLANSEMTYGHPNGVFKVREALKEWFYQFHSPRSVSQDRAEEWNPGLLSLYRRPHWDTRRKAEGDQFLSPIFIFPLLSRCFGSQCGITRCIQILSLIHI